MSNLNGLPNLISMTVLAKLLDLCESLALYIVDKNQQILYWNRGAEQLSGLGCKKVIGKPCLPEYVITDNNDNQEQLVKISRANGNTIEVRKLFEFYIIKRVILLVV
jgi:PAS fold.